MESQQPRFARHVGMDDEVVYSGVHHMEPENCGYLATMLIRKSPAKRRHTDFDHESLFVEPTGARI
jgi:precorrin-2 methylase